MWGIAGYSLERRSPVDRTLAARALLAAIAERGADAGGYAHRSIATSLVLRKQRGGAELAVDSEVIFAPAEETGSSAPALEQLVGTMAAAWLDERRGDLLHLA